MKSKLFICLCGLLFAGFTAKSQESNLSLNLNYNYSFPMNNFKADQVHDASPRGFTGNLMYDVNPKIAVGLGVGYQDYYQRFPRQLYGYGKSQEISAVLTNSIQLVPVMARIEFSPFAQSMSMVRPYISLAAGLNFINYSQYLGQFSSTASNAGFRAQGGLGVKIPVTKSNSFGIDVGGTYDYAPYTKYGFKDLNSVNVHGGVYFKMK